MYSLSSQFLKTWCLLSARRIAAESEAARIATQIEATRIAAKVEADRIAAEVEAARIAAEIARIARRDAFITAQIEAARLSAAESASAHRPVVQSPECKQAERKRYEFMMHMNIIHNIWYLQGKNADESPPLKNYPQEPPSYWAMCCAFMLGIIYTRISRREGLHRSKDRWPNMRDERDHL
jgi:hypothetical protein